jgi:hypothetical protein
MKTTLIALILFLGVAFTSCKDTSKKDNQTMDKDTLVLKPDTAMTQPK